MAWRNYVIIFGLAQVKFLFAASIAYATMAQLSFFEIFIPIVLGALFCFNVVFFLSNKIMLFAHQNRVRRNTKSNKKPKKIFSKKNKWIIKIKRSKKGFFLICLLAPLFLSIPIGTIVVAKFYGDRPKAYYFVTTLLIATSFLLTFINDLVFNLF
ncbi:MAG: hypothetical protein ACJ0QL_06725 [Parvicellaceae bacterium]